MSFADAMKAPALPAWLAPQEHGQGFRPAPASTPTPTNRARRMGDYIAQLNATTDDQWRFEMAEGDERRRGAVHFAKLWDQQVDLDPKGFIWRAVAPEGFDIPQPRVAGAAS